MITPPDNSALCRSPEGYQEVMAFYDDIFDGIDIPYNSRVIDTAFGATHVVTAGNISGKPVVLLHGQNASAASWARWFPSLAKSYRIFAVDVIGGMGKSAPSRPSKKGDAYGLWAKETLDELGIVQANMIGASQGGWVIGKLSAFAPDKVGSVLLISSAGLLPLKITEALRMIPRVLFKPPAEAAEATLAMVSAPDTPPDPYFLKTFELMIRHFRGEGIVPVLTDEELKQLTAPSYLLMGQYETSFNPHKAITRGLRLLPNVITAKIVPNVGHSMLHSHPDWVISRVVRFLDLYAV